MILPTDLLKEKGFEWFRLERANGDVEITAKKTLSNGVVIEESMTINRSVFFTEIECWEKLYDRCVEREKSELKSK